VTVTLPVFVVDSAALAGDPITLDGDEGRHAVVVKRLRVGETLVLTDGRGQAAECEVVSVAKASLEAAVLVRRSASPAQPRLVVVQAIPKGDHAERAVDLLTEIGADVIVPWAAERNVVTWKGDRAVKALHRWRVTATAAAKQSRRLWHPEIRDLHGTDDVLALVRDAAAAYVLHETVATPLTGAAIPADGDVLLVVGPEGGITEDEVSAFTDAGARAVRLGPEVLRSSSAGMAAAALVLSRTPRWT
jgi:16S rRNA (uracil1498-N3)-methyltransferase